MSWSRFESPRGDATVKIGSGNRVTEKRDLADFTRFEMFGSASVTIELGQRQSVTLELDDNLLPLITTDVRNSTLGVGRSEPYFSSGGLRMVIQVLDLSHTSLFGSGGIDVTNISRVSFEAVINGAGTITCEGKVDRVKAEIDGSGTIDAFRLSSKSAYAVINGSGEIKIYASDSLVAVISGVGDIRYKGKPSHVEKFIEGVGSITEE